MKKIVLCLFLSLIYLSVVFNKDVEADFSISAKKLDTKEYLIKKVTIFNMLEKHNSPFKTDADAFMKACITYNIDCYLLPSISGLESTFGKFIYPESHNPFGWGGGLIMFNSWEDCFMAVAAGLRNNYINKGADTIDKIAPIYAESKTWAPRVTYFMNRFMEEEQEVRKTFVL